MVGPLRSFWTQRAQRFRRGRREDKRKKNEFFVFLCVLCVTFAPSASKEISARRPPNSESLLDGAEPQSYITNQSVINFCMSLSKFIGARHDSVQAKRERRKEARPGELLD